MTAVTRSARPVVVGTSLLLLASCTSASPEPTPTVGAASSASSTPPATTTPTSAATAAESVDAATLAKANTACHPYLLYNMAHQFPWTDFTPEQPDVSLLPQIGDFFDKNPANHTLTADLKALGPSTEGAATWAHLLDDLHHRDEVATAQIALARKSDGAGFAANVAESRTVLAAVSSDLIDAGFKLHDDCRSIL